MTSGHILYIPLILFLGVVVGYLVGRQASVQAASEAARRQEMRRGRVEQLRAELRERHSGGPEADQPTSEESDPSVD